MNEQLSVLYVEDDLMSRKVMFMLLKGRMNIENVTIFENSVNFLERVNALEPIPDVVFLDIHVPPIDGFEMLGLLKDSPKFKGIPTIAMTASVMNDEIARLQTAGFDGCIAKPVDKNEFPALLERILSGEKIWSILY